MYRHDRTAAEPSDGSSGDGDHLREDANLLTRFDYLPTTRTIAFLVALLALVWLIESFDIGLVSTLVLILKPHWHLTSSQTGLLGSSATIGLVVGIFPAGRLADRFGRKPVLISGLATFSVFTILSSLSSGIYELFALRILAGIGEGAVFPLPYTILSELVGKKSRGALMGWLNGILNAGYTLPALTGLWVTSSFGWNISWKIPLYIGGVFLVLVPVLIRWLPETPRYLLKRAELQRRDDMRARVRSFVERLEDQAHIEHDPTIVDDDIREVLLATSRRDVRIRTLTRPPYLSRSLRSYAALCSSFVVFYTFLTYAPTILKNLGVTGNKPLLYTAIMMFVSGIGCLVQGTCGDRYGRRPVFGVYIALAAVGMAVIPFRSSVGTPVAVIAGLLIAWFGLGSFPLCKIYLAEQYPTRLRGLGTSTGEMISRALTGGLLVYFLPTLFDQVGTKLIFVLSAIAMVILAAPMVLRGGTETNGRNIEELGTPLSPLTTHRPAGRAAWDDEGTRRSIKSCRVGGGYQEGRVDGRQR